MRHRAIVALQAGGAANRGSRDWCASASFPPGLCARTCGRWRRAVLWQLLRCWHSINLTLRALKGLRRAQWANMFGPRALTSYGSVCGCVRETKVQRLVFCSRGSVSCGVGTAPGKFTLPSARTEMTKPCASRSFAGGRRRSREVAKGGRGSAARDFAPFSSGSKSRPLKAMQSEPAFDPFCLMDCLHDALHFCEAIHCIVLLCGVGRAARKCHDPREETLGCDSMQRSCWRPGLGQSSRLCQ